MAIKTDDKPNLTQPVTSYVRLTPQEIATAIQARGLTHKESFYISGKGNIKYDVIFDQARRILELNHLGSWAKLDNATLARRLIEAIPRLTSIFRPVGTEEEPASTMAEAPAVQGEENPVSMSDTPSEKPFNPFSQSSPRSPESQQRLVPPEKPTRTEHETGTGTDKTHKPDTSEYDNKKKFNEKNSTYSNPTSTKLPDAPKTNQEPRIFSQPDTKIKQDIKASQPTFAGTNTSNTNKFNVDKPKMSLTPALNTQSGIKSPDMKFKQPLGPVATPQVSFKPGLFSTKSISYPLNNGFKNMASSAGRFFKSNFGKFLTPSNISRIGSSVIGGFGGMGVAGMAGAGAGTLGGFFAPEMLKAGGGRMLSAAANKGVNSFMNLSNGISKTSSRFSAASSSLKKSATTKRVAFGLLGLFFAASLLMSLVGGATTAESSPLGSQNQTSGSNTGGGTCPSETTLARNTDPTSCHYLNPGINIFDTNISQESINTYVNNYSSTFTQLGGGTKDEFIRRVNYIVAQSKKAGFNPVLFLGYWKTESRFSTLGSRDMGCAGDTFEAQVDCAVGLSPGGNRGSKCATSKAADSPSCVELRDSIRGGHPDIYTNFPLKYPISTFDDFAEAYGPMAPNLDPGQTNNNCTHTYNTLISVAEELNSCHEASNSTARSSQVTTPTSCPVPNGTINCGSQMTPVNGPLGLCGHCGAGYNSPQEINNCQRYPENKYAIDIATKASETVFFPTIGGNTISWRFVREDVGSSGYIQLFAGEDTSTQDKYSLQIHHTEFGKGNRGTGKSGDYAAMSCATCGAGHVHVQLKSDSTGQWLDAAQTLCR